MLTDKVDPLINKYIDTLFCFERKNQKWRYTPEKEKQTMADIQAKGVDRILEVFRRHKVAYLADEVGMGKTFQALALCVLTLRENPKAKILIFAPRREVANNWVNEYGIFIQEHCKGKLKNILDKNFTELKSSHNLFDLIKNIHDNKDSLFLAKTSSFSAVTDKDDKNRAQEAKKWFGEGVDCADGSSMGKAFNSFLRKKNEPYFDLIIIDEAHYLRRYNSDTQRDKVCKEFFKGLSKKYLLLTGTPNHTGQHDIINTTKYFYTPGEISALSVESIIKEQIIRRNRKLQGKEKFEYRSEEAPHSTLGKSVESELFFAVYQKKLVSKLKDGDLSKGRRMLNYLEGTEFISRKKLSEEQEKYIEEDFQEGSDAQILNELIEEYQKLYKKDSPSHPKYDDLTERLNPNLLKDDQPGKKLIFVRRIPSVNEIARRTISLYDQHFINRFNAICTNKPLSEINLTRERFNKVMQDGNLETLESDAESEDIEQEAESENLPIPNSVFLDLFKRKRSGEFKSTEASNFRLYLLNRYNSPFILFFQPPYIIQALDRPYKISKILKRPSQNNSGEEKEDFLSTVQQARDNCLEEAGGDELFVMANILNKYVDPRIADELTSFETDEIEGFFNYFAKGICLGSSVIIDLFAIYVNLKLKPDNNQRLKGMELYKEFVREFDNYVQKNPLIVKLFEDSVRTFRVIYSKVFKVKKSGLKTCTWNDFNNTQPAYPYSAATKNERILKCFNTPFYPNVLASTSVLKEGVNLQYFCDEIIHYGIAWTPGDNEQRIGRIDRMFGLIDRNLKVNKDSLLKIKYPYLKGTIDEQHVTGFIKRKFHEEVLIEKLQNNIKGYTQSFNTDLDDWEAYLRKPIQKE